MDYSTTKPTDSENKLLKEQRLGLIIQREIMIDDFIILEEKMEIAEKALKRISGMGGNASKEAGNALNLIRLTK